MSHDDDPTTTNGHANATPSFAVEESLGVPPAPTTVTSEPHPILRSWKTLGELGDVFGEAPPRRRWLLRRSAPGLDGCGVLPLGKLGILAAAGGVGKTMACVQLALSVATGRKWLEAFDIAPEGIGRVLLALGEEDEEEVRRRLYKAARAMKLTQEDQRHALERIVALPLAGCHVALTQNGDSSSIETDAARSLRAKMAENDDWRLVILDPLSRFAGPDAETNNAGATRFIETAESLCSVPGGPTVLVVHHSAQHARGSRPAGGGPRDASEVARGATGITDGARWVASLESWHTGATEEQLAHLGVLTIVKNNYAPMLREPIWLRRDRDHGGALREMDASDLKIVEHAEEERKAAKSRKGSESPSAPPNEGPSVPMSIGR